MKDEIDIVNLFSPMLDQAIELASQWHDQTYRKSHWRPPPFGDENTLDTRIPVMAHLTAVATLLLRNGWDDHTAAAGFLHDILEDANAAGDYLPPDRLRSLMGDRVTELVLAVSEKKFDDQGKTLQWTQRKEAYIKNLKHSVEEAMAISLADKLHNLWTMNQGLEQGIDIFSSAGGRRGLSAGPDQQCWFYTAVLDISKGFSSGRLRAMQVRLENELERFKQNINL